MGKKILSVIVPAYNAEKDIEVCLASICRQTYPYLDILVINDGSTDSTSDICDKYKKKDCRVRIITQENRGLLASRKIGVNEALGECVTFVDSDDWIDVDLLEKLMDIVETKKVELVSSGLIFEWPHKKIIYNSQCEEGEYKRRKIEEYIIPNMMKKGSFGEQGVVASVCGKVFQTSLISKALDTVDVNITYGEDGCIVYPSICMADSIYIVGECGYHYIQHNSSMIHSFSVNSFRQISLLNEYLLKTLCQYADTKKMVEQISCYVRGFLIPCVRDVFGYDFTNQMWEFPFASIVQNKNIVIYGAGRVGKSYYKSLKALGYATICGWVDKNFIGIIDGIEVNKPQQLNKMLYDYIIIAIEREDIAQEIREALIVNNVREQKILWEKPKVFFV